MRKEIIYSDFSTLRNAYYEVKNFIEIETGENVCSSKIKIVEDLFICGDDNWDLLIKFVDKYELNTTNFIYSKHFESEAEIFNSGMFLVHLIMFPLFLMIWIFRIAFAGVKNWNQIEFYPDWKPQPRQDLSVGDLIAWLLKKDFCLRKNIKIVFH